MVILAEQQTVAWKPPPLPSEENLTVMVVAVTGAGIGVPENVWVEVPSLISTQSLYEHGYSILNAANVSVTGSPVVDSSLHS